MKAIFINARGYFLFLMIIMGSAQAYAGTSTVFSRVETIEVSNPTKAFNCHLGDGGSD